MKVFILEDDPFRMKIFKRNLIGNTVTHTDDADIAVMELIANPYDVIFLDHDLGGEQFVPEDPNENNGTKVVSSCSKWASDKNVLIVVHSLNGPAALNMIANLEMDGYLNVKRIPFTQLVNGFKL